MATSLFFMSSTNEMAAAPGGSEEARAELIQRQPRARRINKTTTQHQQQGPHKQRRRGLGVAELERLSIQERLKKMPPQQHFPAAAPPTEFHIQSSPFVGAHDQTASYGFHGYCMSSSPARGFVVPASSGYATGGGVVTGRVVGSPGYGFVGAPVHHGSGNNNNVMLEASRELTSMPNAQCNLDCCSTCCFKKKGSNGRNVGVDRARSERNRDRSRSINRMQQQDNNAKDFLGLNLGNIYYGGSGSVCCEGTHHVGYGYGGICTTHTQAAALEKEVEAMADRRKGKNSLSGGGGGIRGSSSRVVLEYEFFPRMGTRSSLPQDLNIPCSVVVDDQDSAASFAATTTTATTTTTTTNTMISGGGGGGGSYGYEAVPIPHSSIDLSLRLSTY